MTKSVLIRYLFVAAWMFLIFMLSHQVSDVSSGQSGWVRGTVEGVIGVELPEVLVRKGAHVLVYFVLGGLVIWLLRGYKIAWRKAAILAVFISFAYAVSDELHQSFIPGRNAEVSDILLDTVAATVGIVIYTLTSRVISPRGEQ